jgi:hypothetical protein
MIISSQIHCGCIILFGASTIQEMVEYKELLDLYCKAIGMEANFSKSSILFNGMKEDLERPIV